MSNRTLIELNHDYCPNAEEPGALAAWAMQMVRYMRAGDKEELPRGVTFKAMRHHSEPDPMKGHGDPS